MNIRKGNTIIVISGKEKGKRGKVLRLITEKQRIIVERVNIIKRHTRPTQRNPRGGILEKEGSIPLSNVALWCNKCGAGRRAKVEFVGKNEKTRSCIKCGSVFEVS
jgi:large subunit ribosomal protein L24